VIFEIKKLCRVFNPVLPVPNRSLNDIFRCPYSGDCFMKMMKEKNFSVFAEVENNLKILEF